MSTTETEPRTHAEAIKVAEKLSAADLVAALAGARDAVTVLKARSPRKHCCHTVTELHGDRVAFAFEYCDRKGYTQSGFIAIRSGFYTAGDYVFHLYNEGRFVTLETTF